MQKQPLQHNTRSEEPRKYNLPGKERNSWGDLECECGRKLTGYRDAYKQAARLVERKEKYK